MNYKVGDKIIVTNKNLIRNVGEIYIITYIMGAWVVVSDPKRGFDFPLAFGEFLLYSSLIKELI
jgi:hypothetical protein